MKTLDFEKIFDHHGSTLAISIFFLCILLIIITLFMSFVIRDMPYPLMRFLIWMAFICLCIYFSLPKTEPKTDDR